MKFLFEMNANAAIGSDLCLNTNLFDGVESPVQSIGALENSSKATSAEG